MKVIEKRQKYTAHKFSTIELSSLFRAGNSTNITGGKDPYSIIQGLYKLLFL